MKSLTRVLALLLISSAFFFIQGRVYSINQKPAAPPALSFEGNPRCIALYPEAGLAVLAGAKANQVCLIDLNSAGILATIPTRQKPFGVALDPVLNLALISHTLDDSLSLIHLDSYQVAATVSVGRSPVNAAVYGDPNGSRIGLVANYHDHSVSVVDLNGFQVIQTIPVGQGPRDIAVDPELKLALTVNSGENSVSVIDLESRQVTRVIPAGRHPLAISLNPETHLAAIIYEKESFVTVIDLLDWGSRSIAVDKNPVRVAINPLDNKTLVLSGKERRLQWIDLDGNTLPITYSLPKKTRGLAVDHLTNRALLVDRQTDRLSLLQLPNPIPELSSISPNRILRGSPGARLTIEGAGFIKSSTLSLQPGPAPDPPVQFLDNRHLACDLPPGSLSQAGIYQVQVNNPAPDGGPSNSRQLRIENPVPIITAFYPATAAAGGSDLTLTIDGSGFFPDTTLYLDGQVRTFNRISGTRLEVGLGPADLWTGRQIEIVASNPSPGGGPSNPIGFTVLNPAPILSSIRPSSEKAGSPGLTLTLAGGNFAGTATVFFNHISIQPTYFDGSHLEVSIPAQALTTAGSFSVAVINPTPGGGASGALPFLVTSVEPLAEGSFGKKYEDLLPADATLQNYDSKRFSLITGLVKDFSGNPLVGVTVAILSHPEYGTAQTDGSGLFSIPVDGGGVITLIYQKTGFLGLQRQVSLGWNTIAAAETIVLIPEDPAATPIAFDGQAATVLTHTSSITSDAFGNRALTMVFSGDNRAWVKDAQGMEQPLTNITVRATEYTTPESMPAKLPPTSAFTYCAELSVEGAAQARFEKPVVVFVDNFLGFNVGEVVPAGYYDRERGLWVASKNGVVVRLLDTNGDGLVDALDSVGDGLPHDLNGNGSFDDEVAGIQDPGTYQPNSTYWRVEVSHFTPWDFNWPFGPPADAVSPNPQGEPVLDSQCPNDDETCLNSYVENRSRIFHEDLPILGTGQTLHYASHRTKGYKSVITIPASGAGVPASLLRIIVKMEVAGRVFEDTLPAGPNQQAEFVWDGLDFLGRPVFGSTTAAVSIGFVYQGVYYAASSDFEQAFGQTGINVTGFRNTRQEVVVWKKGNLTIYRGAGTLAEGWTLSAHHVMNPADPNTLFKGDGTTLKQNARVINTVAGNGGAGYQGDGIPATQTSLHYPRGVTIDNAGNVFIADTENHRVRKVNTGGIISTIAGNGQAGDGGDGGPAVQAGLNFPETLAVDSTGNLYIADTGNNRIRKVAPGGIISTLAGNGQAGFSGDGGPAAQAGLDSPLGVAADGSGNIFISDSNNNRIRKVDSGGIISTIAGTGVAGFSGDGGPAVVASFNGPYGVAVDSAGNIYIADSVNSRIRKIDSSGIITTWAGNGHWNFGGDGGPAIQAALNNPRFIAVDPAGNIYISDFFNQRIRKVETGGIISTMAGNGQQAFSGDGGPSTEAGLYTSMGIAVDDSGNLYLADWRVGRIRKVSFPEALRSSVSGGDIVFTDENGLGYVMSSTGLHKSTHDLATGTTLLTFGYDAGNRLVSISDRFGNRMTLQRDVLGRPLSIVSPDGLVTGLSLDGNNHLTTVSYPINTSYAFAYTPDGLLTEKIDPNGNRFRQYYDANGLITQVLDPEGGAWSYSRTVDPAGTITLAVQTAEGNTTTYQDQSDSAGAYRSLKTYPSGAGLLFSRSSDGYDETWQPTCGLNLALKYGLDPVYKTKYLKEYSGLSPQGLSQSVSEGRSYQDTNADTVPDLIGRTLTVNGRMWTSTQNTLSGLITGRSPAGRSMALAYSPSSLLTQEAELDGLFPAAFSYDGRGRPVGMTIGSRTSAIAYDSQGQIERLTSPDQRTFHYTYDALGRIKTEVLPDNTLIEYAYDQNGNLTVLTNPKAIAHTFNYTGVNQRKSLLAPLSGNYQYAYDRERNLTSLSFPSGRLITNTYSNGLLASVTRPEGETRYSYNCASLLSEATKGSEKITYAYDGPFLRTDSRSGLMNRNIDYSYDNAFRLTTVTYEGVSQTFTYDYDGLLTSAGSYAITRNARHGLPERVSDGTLSLSRAFNGYGELEGAAYAIGGVQQFGFSLTKDLVGRIIGKTETWAGEGAGYEYAYDSNGRLLEIRKNGLVVETYAYDANGNRTLETNSLKGVANRAYTYSNEDHLITAGTDSYQFDGDGFLTGKTSGATTTTYQYASRGELVNALLPGGMTISYDHDPMGRIIAKRLNGAVSEKYLWADGTRLLAVYDAFDHPIIRFQYADDRVPLSMIRNGVNYYLLYDTIGSLRAVADPGGAIIKRVDYDSFGHIVNDTNLAFGVPLGFAGGFYDRDTKLVRFGARDYDPALGRWTAKDPIDFAGGDVNLYGYVGNSPVNWVDPSGLWNEDVHSGIGNPFYGTHLWATQLGLSDQQAMWIALGNNGADVSFSGWMPVFGLQSRHFNQPAYGMNGFSDSRDYWGSIELQRAVNYYKAGNCRAAYGHLGKGLHSIQDKIAHRDWDTKWHGFRRHPTWYDDWNHPGNISNKILTEIATKKYLLLFLNQIGR